MKGTQDIASQVTLPSGWALTNIGNLSLKIHYGYTSRAFDEPVGPKMLRITDIQNGSVNWEAVPHCIIEEEKKQKYLLEEGDLVFARTGATVGKSFLIKGRIPESVFASYLIRIVLSENLSREYVYYFFQSFPYWSQIREGSVGIGQPNVNATKLSKIIVPLAPSSEQRRIVARIEELFTELDAGVESLRKVKAQLQRYLQAVLKHAFEGRLTEEWRKAHRREPVFAVLERFLLHKRREWEKAQFAKMKRKGRIPKNERWKSRYSEPPKVDSDNLPDLPEGWIWTNFEQLAENIPNAIKAGPFGSSLKKEFYVPTGYKIYGQEQVIRNDPFYGNYHINEQLFNKLQTCSVKPGDLLISLVGTIGKVLILPKGIEPGIINPRLVKLSLEKTLVNPKYLKFYLMSSVVADYFSLGSHGGTMDILNLTILKNLPLPLPPLFEQELLIRKIETSFSLIDNTGETISQNLARTEQLRQCILGKGFVGELVPQDTSDEPAEELLKRIRNGKRLKQTKQIELKNYVK